MVVDGFKNLKQGKGKYACLLVDPVAKQVIDVLLDRRLRTLGAYYILEKHWKTLNKYTYNLSYSHYYDYRLRYHITP